MPTGITNMKTMRKAPKIACGAAREMPSEMCGTKSTNAAPNTAPLIE